LCSVACVHQPTHNACQAHDSHRPSNTVLHRALFPDVLHSLFQCDVDAFLLLYVTAITHANDSLCSRSHAIVLHSQAFAYCASLTSANLTGVASIGEYVTSQHLLDFPLFLERMSTSHSDNTPKTRSIDSALRCAPTNQRTRLQALPH
jgi:hypothetical protein